MFQREFRPEIKNRMQLVLNYLRIYGKTNNSWLRTPSYISIPFINQNCFITELVSLKTEYREEVELKLSPNINVCPLLGTRNHYHRLLVNRIFIYQHLLFIIFLFFFYLGVYMTCVAAVIDHITNMGIAVYFFFLSCLLFTKTNIQRHQN